MSIGVGIIGGGIFAREEHLPTVKASRTLSLKAIYSRSLKSAQSLSSNSADVELYSDDSGSGKSFNDLLAREDIHAVIIALPIANQPSYIRSALSAGKHVLSEKPIAENLHDAQDLLQWYHSSTDSQKVTWSVAENFRYLSSFEYAAAELAQMGRVLGFGVKCYGNVESGSKYFETAWRKTPTHQGGFLLDGGVHFIAGLRLLLGSSNPIAQVSAYTTQLQSHLPPVDTVDAIVKTASGATGTFSVSFGTTMKGNEWTVACEKGCVSVSGSTVTMINAEGNETAIDVEDEGSGVQPEVRAWGEALAEERQNENQRPEEALADLEVLEKLLRSGEQNGKPFDCSLQSI